MVDQKQEPHDRIEGLKRLANGAIPARRYQEGAEHLNAVERLERELGRA